jgi:hypothetical protein
MSKPRHCSRCQQSGHDRRAHDQHPDPFGPLPSPPRDEPDLLTALQDSVDAARAGRVPSDDVLLEQVRAAVPPDSVGQSGRAAFGQVVGAGVPVTPQPDPVIPATVDYEVRQLARTAAAIESAEAGEPAPGADCDCQGDGDFHPIGSGGCDRPLTGDGKLDELPDARTELVKVLNRSPAGELHVMETTPDRAYCGWPGGWRSAECKAAGEFKAPSGVWICENDGRQLEPFAAQTVSWRRQLAERESAAPARVVVDTAPIDAYVEPDVEPDENRCSCGKTFPKSFGLRVHQRTCKVVADGRRASGPPAEPLAEPTADPARCQECGEPLDNGESFLCDLCTAAAITPPWRTALGPDEPIRVTVPGVYQLEAAEYHDPAVTGDWLSNSDARQLILPGCPAQFRWDRDHGVKKESDEFDLGHAVHTGVLGKGEMIVTRPAQWDSWRTAAAKAWRAEQRAAGRTVLDPPDMATAEGMIAAFRNCQTSADLLDQPGRPEIALFWVDEQTGVKRRCMIDWLPVAPDEDGLIQPVDIKTSKSVAPDYQMERSIYDYGYHRQAATIADGIVALGLAKWVEIVFLFQAKKAPYLVTPVILDDEALRIGRIENLAAMKVYRKCLETGVWPKYSEEPVLMSVPGFVANLYEVGVI